MGGGEGKETISSHRSLSQHESVQMRFVSRMNLPTLYRCDSSSAPSYFHPTTAPQKAQLTSLTVCAPVTSCRGTAACVCVLGKVLVLVRPAAVEQPGGVGETRYARPCRPVKPLLMICELRPKSAAQRAQRSRDTWPRR